MLLWSLACGLAGCAATTESDNGKTESRGNDCASCHVDEWSETAAPAHTQFGFGQECGSCHNEDGWSPANGYAHTATFPLTLGHANRACASCHTSGFAKGATSSECVACHGPQAGAVIDPIHAGLSQSCFACHKTDRFRPSTFVHAWPLSGVHAMVSCRSCHSSTPAVYEGTSSACVTCHADDRARAETVVSGHSAFGERCESCHGFNTFKR